MGLAGMLPGEGVWDIRMRKAPKDPGRYRLEVRDPGSAVFAGPFNLRFPTPEYAVSWLSMLTDVEEDDPQALATLAAGKYLDTIGYSSNWLYVISALFHSGGPIGGYPVSLWWTDAASGPDPIFVAYDPLQEAPEGYFALQRRVDIKERSYLTYPDDSKRTIAIDRIIMFWDSKVGRLPVAFVEIHPVDGGEFLIELTRGPFIQDDEHGALLFTKEGEWRVRSESAHLALVKNGSRGSDVPAKPTPMRGEAKTAESTLDTENSPAKAPRKATAKPPAKPAQKPVKKLSRLVTETSAKPAPKVVAKPAVKKPAVKKPAKKLPTKGKTPTEYVELFIDKDADRARDVRFVITDHGSFMRREGMWKPFYFDGSYDPDGLEIVTIPREAAKPFIVRWDENIPITRDDLRPYEIPSPLASQFPSKGNTDSKGESQ